LIETFSQLR